MYCHLMVPVDTSLLSAANVDAAIKLAKPLGARIVFFHATADLGATDEGALLRTMNPEAFADVATGDTQAVLGKAAAAAAEANVACETMSRVCDRPAEAILEVANAKGCDLIVMASRGARGLAGWLHSSQTERVLRQSSIALLVTRVAANDPLDASERALGIIHDEHRSIAAVVRGMQELVAQAETMGAALDLVSLEAMLTYLRDFPQRLHHPKEEQYLHPRLRERAPGSAALLNEIEAQHARELLLVSEAFVLLASARSLPSVESTAALVAGFRALTDAVWEHIGLEEREVLPQAQLHLLAQDWVEMAAAFERNDDPGFGELAAGEFKRLFTRIANLFPRART